MRKKKKITFTKWIVGVLIAIAVIDLQLTYVLAFMGSPETLQETTGKLITEILGVVFVYCVKSFFETREEEKNRLIREVGEITSSNDMEEYNKDNEVDPDFQYMYIGNNRNGVRR